MVVSLTQHMIIQMGREVISGPIICTLLVAVEGLCTIMFGIPSNLFKFSKLVIYIVIQS
jgi:hypothetical protein